MEHTQHHNNPDLEHSPEFGSDNEVNANAPGQATSGTDRAEVDSAHAHQTHHAGEQPGTGANVPRSEGAKNQDATSQQSRALSGTTAPRKG